MKRKIWMILLAVCLSCCFFVACGESSADSSSEQKIVKLVDSEIFLEIGDTYQLKTDDGVLYDTYESDNIAVCTVNAHGQIVAVGVGTATVSVTTESGKLSCTVTVQAGEQVEQEVYYVRVSCAESVKVGESVRAEATVLKNGEPCEEMVTWSVDSETVAFSENGNTLTLTGQNKGFCEVGASFGGFVGRVTLKVYDNDCILETPVFSLDSGVLEWTAVENANAYRVSLDEGNSFQELTETRLELPNEVNPLGIIVVAVAEKTSLFMDSECKLQDTYAVTDNALENATKNVAVTGGNGEYTISSSITAEYGNKLFCVYGDENALFHNGGDLEVFENASIVLEVKGTTGEKVYIVSASDYNRAVMCFTLTESYQTIGYRLNAFGKECYVSSSASVTVKGVRLERNRENYAYASIRDADKNVQFIDTGFGEDFLALSSAYKVGGYDYIGYDGAPYQAEAIAFCVNNDYDGMLLDFTSLVPQTNLGYDYFVWKIWAEKEGSFIIKQKDDWTQVNKVLQAGWNEVKIFYADISDDVCQLLFQEKNFDITSETVTVKLGRVKGVKGIAFADSCFSTANVKAESGYILQDLYLSNTGTEYFCEALQVIVDNDYNGNLLDFTPFVPTQENEKGYIWKIWAEKAGTIIIKQKSDWTQKKVKLVAGWNEVKLTYKDMTDDLFQILVQEKNFEGQNETIVLKFGVLTLNTSNATTDGGHNDFNDPFTVGKKENEV